MNTTALIIVITLLAGGISQAGDYYIYHDSDGRTWLPNQDPRKKDESSGRLPDNVKIIKQYQWQDVANEQLTASPSIAPPPVTKGQKFCLLMSLFAAYVQVQRPASTMRKWERGALTPKE